MADSPVTSHQMYQYQPLQTDEIRVLKLCCGSADDSICCHLETVSIDKCGKPEALSYTWGDEAASVPIKVDGEDLLITPNLHAALLQLRHIHSPALPSDPRLKFNTIFERFQSIANSRYFTFEGRKAVSECYGQGLAEYIALCISHAGVDAEPRGGETQQSFTARLLGSDNLDQSFKDEIFNRRSDLLQVIIDQHVIEPGRAALDHIPRLLWVDAVCINQSDFDERARQVSLMRRIYR